MRCIPNPPLALCGKYDRLDPRLLRAALDAGITAQDIGEVIDDAYSDLDDDQAEHAIRGLILDRQRDPVAC